MSKYPVELVTNRQYFNYAYDFVCYSVFCTWETLCITAPSHLQVPRPNYSSKAQQNHGSVMSVDVQLLRNAHVPSMCSADSGLLICGSDTSNR